MPNGNVKKNQLDIGEISFDEDVKIELEEEKEEVVKVIQVEKDKEPIKEQVSETETKVTIREDTSTTNFDVDVGSVQISGAGIATGEIGMEISRFPVEKMRFSKNAKTLIAILSNKVIALKTHYNIDLGSYVCFGGKCCQVDQLPKVRYLFPILVYTTDRAGKPVTKDIDFKVLSVGNEQYQSIVSIKEMLQDITMKDILIICTDEKYQKISLQFTVDARWKKSDKLVKEVKAFWRKHYKDIPLAVARNVTAEEFDRRMGTGEGAVNPQDGDVQFQDVFD